MNNRLNKFVKMLPPDIDAAIISSDLNRRYFLGFVSSAGTLVVTRDKRYLIIDSRYFEAASKSVSQCDIILQDKLYNQIDGLMDKHNAKRIGIESESLSLSEFMRLKSRLPDALIMEDERVSEIIRRLRAIKDESEIKSVQSAQDIADKTFEHILDFIRPGKTELEIAIEMEEFSRREGSEEPAFPFIVAAGANSSRPHAAPSGNKVKRGDFITLDFGATVDGYRSDMTRTIAVEAADGRQREVYGLVQKAQLAAENAVKAGVCCMNIDKIARDIIDFSDYRGLFGHGLGHSLGLEIHEKPSFSRECADKLEPGMIMSVEPGIYIPGEFGVRIEDIVAVTENGCRNLVKSGKNLIIL